MSENFVQDGIHTPMSYYYNSDWSAFPWSVTSSISMLPNLWLSYERWARPLSRPFLLAGGLVYANLLGKDFKLIIINSIKVACDLLE